MAITESQSNVPYLNLLPFVVLRCPWRSSQRADRDGDTPASPLQLTGIREG